MNVLAFIAPRLHGVRLRSLLAVLFLLLKSLGSSVYAEIPELNVNLGDLDLATQSIPLLILLTVWTLAPSIVVLMTSFTRIVIVLGFTRNALGTQNMPPNQVLTGLALILTFFIMSPTIVSIYNEAWVPFAAGDIDMVVAAELAEAPIKNFMLMQTYPEDIALFVNLYPGELDFSGEVPFVIALPAFIVSELRTAFIMGFLIYIPFLIIDMVVASTLMSMGMMMLPPVMISMPFKVLLFTLVNGWHLVVDSILRSFYFNPL